jgi:hypothetical protein
MRAFRVLSRVWKSRHHHLSARMSRHVTARHTGPSRRAVSCPEVGVDVLGVAFPVAQLALDVYVVYVVTFVRARRSQPA